jgi:hypothetical protein
MLTSVILPVWPTRQLFPIQVSTATELYSKNDFITAIITYKYLQNAHVLGHFTILNM